MKRIITTVFAVAFILATVWTAAKAGLDSTEPFVYSTDNGVMTIWYPAHLGNHGPGWVTIRKPGDDNIFQTLSVNYVEDGPALGASEYITTLPSESGTFIVVEAQLDGNNIDDLPDIFTYNPYNLYIPVVEGGA